MSTAGRIQDLPRPRRGTSTREVPLSLPELVKFTALAALLAMFADAAVAHAMLWGNDPYWTYWVTDALARHDDGPDRGRNCRSGSIDTIAELLARTDGR